MRKVPTLYRRDPDNRGRVIVGDVTPGCEWVLAGEGTPTRKRDGTCTMLDGEGRWWARREVKPGKVAPTGWVEVDADPATGKRQGWEPIESSPWAKVHAEAVADPPWESAGGREPGTYELVGPKINGNPEGLNLHTLIRHGEPALTSGVGMSPAAIMDACETLGWEGIVWWRDIYDPDCEKAKLKVRDMQ